MQSAFLPSIPSIPTLVRIARSPKTIMKKWINIILTFLLSICILLFGTFNFRVESCFRSLQIGIIRICQWNSCWNNATGSNSYSVCGRRDRGHSLMVLKKQRYTVCFRDKADFSSGPRQTGVPGQPAAESSFFSKNVFFCPKKEKKNPIMGEEEAE